MSDSESRQSTELPVACTLHAEDGSERLVRWRALSARAAPKVERQADALVVIYPAGDGVREELERLAVAERQCCSFADWEVNPDRDRAVLRITSHADGLAAIAALFDASPA